MNPDYEIERWHDIGEQFKIVNSDYQARMKQLAKIFTDLNDKISETNAMVSGFTLDLESESTMIPLDDATFFEQARNPKL